MRAFSKLLSHDRMSLSGAHLQEVNDYQKGYLNVSKTTQQEKRKLPTEMLVCTSLELQGKLSAACSEFSFPQAVSSLLNRTSGNLCKIEELTGATLNMRNCRLISFE